MKQKIFLLALLSFNTFFAQNLKRKYFNGVAVTSVNDSIIKSNNYQYKNGLLVIQVTSGASAANCGVKNGDIIISLNDQPLNATTDLKLDKLALLREGDELRYKTWRKGKEIILKGKAIGRLPEKKENINYAYGSVKYENGYLRSIISTPVAAAKKLPAILFIQGYTCSQVVDLNEKHPYRRLTDGLTQNGFLVMRVEKPGVGESEGTPPCEDIDIYEEAKGFENALQALKNNPQVDTNNIFIWGHSMGGVIAPMLTSKYKWVKGAVVYGTLHRIWGEYILNMNRLQSDGFGSSPVEVEQIVRGSRKIIYEIYTQKKSPLQFAKENPELVPILKNQFDWKEGTDKIFTRSAAFNQTLDDLNLVDMWSKTNCKVLAMYGESDVQALNSEGAENIVKTVNYYHPKNGTLVLLPKTDHCFVNINTIEDDYKIISTPEYTEMMYNNFNNDVVKISKIWLASVMENKSVDIYTELKK